MPVQYNSIQINNKKVWYRHFENHGKPCFIFIPGWPLPGHNHAKSLDAVAEGLGQTGFNLYIPDLPGLMRSDTIDSNWTLADFTDFIEEFRKTLNLQNIILGGQSFGGRLSVTYTLKYQDKGHIRELILINPSAFSKNQLGFFQNLLHYLFLQSNKVARYLLTLKIIPKNLKILLIRNFTGFPRNFSFDGDIEKRINTLNFFINFKDRLKTYPFEEIKVPALLIWGVPDYSLPIELARYLKSTIPNSTLVTLSGGHTAVYKHPEKVGELIKKYSK